MHPHTLSHQTNMYSSTVTHLHTRWHVNRHSQYTPEITPNSETVKIKIRIQIQIHFFSCFFFFFQQLSTAEGLIRNHHAVSANTNTHTRAYHPNYRMEKETGRSAYLYCFKKKKSLQLCLNSNEKKKRRITWTQSDLFLCVSPAQRWNYEFFNKGSSEANGPLVARSLFETKNNSSPNYFSDPLKPFLYHWISSAVLFWMPLFISGHETEWRQGSCSAGFIHSHFES